MNLLLDSAEEVRDRSSNPEKDIPRAVTRAMRKTATSVYHPAEGEYYLMHTYTRSIHSHLPPRYIPQPHRQ